MHSKLPEDKRKMIFSRLDEEPSDTILANEFGVHRKTIWRLRKEIEIERTSSGRKTQTIQPPLSVIPPKVKRIPPMALPNINTQLKPSESPPKSKSKVTTVPTKDVSTKVTVKVSLDTYFAVQRLGRDNYQHVAQEVLKAAEKRGILFRKLQVLELMAVGATSFIRFRSDVKAEEISKIVGDLSEERAIISQGGDGGYYAKFPNGKRGKYPTSSMCLGSKAGYGQVYSGTKIKRWRHQFSS